MARPTKSGSRSLTARQRARQAQEAEFERQKRITDLLAEVFAALDARAAADVTVGKSLDALKQAGEPVSVIAKKTGLTPREVNNLIALTGPELTDEPAAAQETASDQPTQEAAAKQTSHTPGAAVEVEVVTPTSTSHE